MIKLYFAILLMLIAVASLIYSTLSMVGLFAGGLLLSQLFTMLGCFVLLGFGAGLPIVILASVLGWLQLVLLISGNIDPHLAKESFMDVLKTIFSKL
ncbi:MAG: hypothetical protein AB7V32_10775 [Candidatus Berkiella sp.]